MFGGSVSIGTRNAIRLRNGFAMRRTAATMAVLTLTVLWASVAFAVPQQSQSKPRTPVKQTSMTGCVDEQDGRYILIHDQTRALIANLEAEGFPPEGFAKHLGHKVTVRGSVASEGEHPVFKVRSIETISDACGSQHLH